MNQRIITSKAIDQSLIYFPKHVMLFHSTVSTFSDMSFSISFLEVCPQVH